MVAYYDNRDTFADPVLADVDRVYCFDWQKFGDADWSVLLQVYRSLPGWCECRDVPYWFGTDDEEIPHLYASVEPSGLQVCGMLSTTDWIEWASQFGLKIAGLPATQRG